MEIDIQKINNTLREKTPAEIISWALAQSEKAVVTTNFRPYEGAILHACTQVKSDIDVIWCDTGYNTPNTYKHAETLIAQLSLNIDLYVPKQTSAHRDIVLGIPGVNDENHQLFTEQVKLEPFKRAMEFHKPTIWFTNLRKGQTAFRDSIDIISQGKDGVLKVSPFYHWSDEKLDSYLEAHQIPNEFNYFDPTKVLENRECGLHS
ncbi:phosphoadenosine phosphosulfate reductase family protein [Kordia sp.]|uniref:phosphoadenosine phosphosulfate reductase domain-containing protein n=1 Tax=Kordia sp. TaxID=1965332 RepID=UPI003D6AB010